VQPKFLICDEPVSALDVSVQAAILNLLKDLQAEFELTYLFIAHDLAVVRHMSDDIIVMNRGVIVEHGAADAVCENPQHDYTRRLISSIPALG
jgi:ABC-type oligopeptide transport system ATPase subunit